ncbi:hypothetical protein D9M71_84940 [compost metagenome]
MERSQLQHRAPRLDDFRRCQAYLHLSNRVAAQREDDGIRLLDIRVAGHRHPYLDTAFVGKPLQVGPLQAGTHAQVHLPGFNRFVLGQGHDPFIARFVLAMDAQPIMVLLADAAPRHHRDPGITGERQQVEHITLGFLDFRLWRVGQRLADEQIQIVRVAAALAGLSGDVADAHLMPIAGRDVGLWHTEVQVPGAGDRNKIEKVARRDRAQPFQVYRLPCCHAGVDGHQGSGHDDTFGVQRIVFRFQHVGANQVWGWLADPDFPPFRHPGFARGVVDLIEQFEITARQGSDMLAIQDKNHLVTHLATAQRPLLHVGIGPAVTAGALPDHTDDLAGEHAQPRWNPHDGPGQVVGEEVFIAPIHIGLAELGCHPAYADRRGPGGQGGRETGARHFVGDIGQAAGNGLHQGIGQVVLQ